MWQVIGQPKATGLLGRSIKTNQLSHAYLFVGPPHVGKFTLALNLAQAVNCQAGEDVPCGECAPCVRIAAGKHTDIQVIGPASDGKRDIGRDQIEEMQAAASLPPFEGRCKVFILDRAETLSHVAANRLLKTLEEPLPRVLIVLVSAREKDVLPTIVSRCQRVELCPLPIPLVKQTLTKERGIDEESADLLARLSGGCLGWALLAIEDQELVETRNQRLSELIDVIRTKPAQRLAYAGELASRFSKKRSDVEESLGLWVQWWHDLLLIKGGHGALITNVDQQAMLSQQASDLSMKQIIDSVHHLQQAGRQLEQNANPRLALEVLMLNLP
ncbi:ATP-binding protein [Chloroflexota bacterium]